MRLRCDDEMFTENFGWHFTNLRTKAIVDLDFAPYAQFVAIV